MQTSQMQQMQRMQQMQQMQHMQQVQMQQMMPMQMASMRHMQPMPQMPQMQQQMEQIPRVQQMQMPRMQQPKHILQQPQRAEEGSSQPATSSDGGKRKLKEQQEEEEDEEEAIDPACTEQMLSFQELVEGAEAAAILAARATDDFSYVGRIARFCGAYGFIECLECDKEFGKRDVYVSDRHFKGVRLDDTVQFRVGRNKDGLPFALEVEVLTDLTKLKRRLRVLKDRRKIMVGLEKESLRRGLREP